MYTCIYCSLCRHVLDEASKHHPNDCWWVKADGCDLVSGLSESMAGIWHGDVDLNDGALEREYNAYKDRLQEIDKLKVHSNISRSQLIVQLNSIMRDVNKDREFVHTGMCIIFFCYEHAFSCSSSAISATV